jgi:chromosome segregation ATPase
MFNLKEFLYPSNMFITYPKVKESPMSRLFELKSQMRQLEKSQKIAKAELKASQRLMAELQIKIETRNLRVTQIFAAVMSTVRQIKRAEDRIRSNKQIMKTLQVEIDTIRFARSLEAVAG